jgi:hypothetical protein
MQKRKNTRRRKRIKRINEGAGVDVSLQLYFREWVAAGVVKKKRKREGERGKQP